MQDEQTFIDAAAKVGFAKRYTEKTPITAADLLTVGWCAASAARHPSEPRLDGPRHRILWRARAFRTPLYSSLGKTPMQTFLASLAWAEGEGACLARKHAGLQPAKADASSARVSQAVR